MVKNNFKFMRYLLVILLFVSTFLTSAFTLEESVVYVDMQSDTVVRPFRLDTIIDPTAKMTLREKFAYKSEETGARINIIDDKTINLEKKTDLKVRAFRVRVYFDNSQNARQKSAEIVKDFELNYPEIPVNMHYAAPYFHVTVGQFLTYHEASNFMRKVLSSYPKSFIVAEQMSILEFGSPKEELQVDTIYLDSFGRDIIDSTKIENADYKGLMNIF